MIVEDRKKERWAPSRLRAFRPQMAALIVLSLLVQLFFIPYHQASSAPLPGSDVTRIAAELKAVFGDAASLCVNIDDKSAPGAPAGHCNDECPFCRFAAEAASLVVPDLPLLPFRLDAVASRIDLPAESSAPPAAPLTRQKARAPPSIV